MRQPEDMLSAAHVARLALCRVPFAMLVVVLVVVLACLFMLAYRYEQTRRGMGGVSSPGAAYGDTLPPSGRFTSNITYTCLDADGSGEVSADVLWDDAWFAVDATVYNHDLARACSVLSALAYSESGYYQEGSTQPAYMEDALADLGFDRVSTESYRYRSEIMDQVLNLVTQREDTVAYAIASKRIDDSSEADGATGGAASTRTVILVSIRGSYGSEWLSNFKLIADGGASADDSSASSPAADDDGAQGDASSLDVLSLLSGAGAGASAEASARDDSATEEPPSCYASGRALGHPGYVDAAGEIIGELKTWVDEAHARGDEVNLVATGHSRGGAVANLVAAAALDSLAATEQDDASEQGKADGIADEALLRAGDTAAAYTFAAPASTTSREATSERYGSIFNIINPSDLMPHLPLEEWGYRRYGVDLVLPALDDASFEQRYEKMCAWYEDAMGKASSYEPEDARAVAAVTEDIAEHVGSVDDLFTPWGVAETIAACARHVDPARILLGHYPSVYIAWMYSLDAAW